MVSGFLRCLRFRKACAKRKSTAPVPVKFLAPLRPLDGPVYVAVADEDRVAIHFCFRIFVEASHSISNELQLVCLPRARFRQAGTLQYKWHQRAWLKRLCSEPTAEPGDQLDLLRWHYLPQPRTYQWVRGCCDMGLVLFIFNPQCVSISLLQGF
jgi:hypothetical protein